MNKKVIKDYYIQIQEIKYNSLDEPSEGVTVLCTDALSDVKLENNILEGTFKRDIAFKPDSLYRLSISSKIKVGLEDDDKGDHYENLEEELIKIINNARLIDNTVALIANISSSQGLRPIITPTEVVE